MWKVLIADDEPKIRRGLKGSLNWQDLDMEVVGEAADGEMAFDMANQLKPDILLLDICMPFLNGLQLVEQLRSSLENCMIIVITGYDEFAYAQQAVKLKVFDYLLKPVAKEQLMAVLTKAHSELALLHSKSRYINWADRQMKQNGGVLKESVFKQWITGLPAAEALEQLRYLGVQFSSVTGMILIKVIPKLNRSELIKEWDGPLLLFAVQNVIADLLSDWQPSEIFKDNADNFVILAPIHNYPAWLDLGSIFQQTVENRLKHIIITGQKQIEDIDTDVPEVYKELVAAVAVQENCTPVVLLCRQHIEMNYFKEELSLQEVAKTLQISPTYLSRLLKQETGISFVDYLTHVRVKKAIQLMNDPMIKLYEIAERVGYSSQHYFSTAFKKALGISPQEYRKRGWTVECRDKG
ncbi:response regulator transcription factor [Lucifera butyrica]|nr:response regulator [Lucifera butyrica]